MYVSSVELKRWCDHNRNRFYVPEWLLDEWDMKVEDTFSDGGTRCPDERTPFTSVRLPELLAAIAFLAWESRLPLTVRSN